jgi:hypothetical protein
LAETPTADGSLVLATFLDHKVGLGQHPGRRLQVAHVALQQAERRHLRRQLGLLRLQQLDRPALQRNQLRHDAVDIQAAADAWR